MTDEEKIAWATKHSARLRAGREQLQLAIDELKKELAEGQDESLRDNDK